MGEGAELSLTFVTEFGFQFAYGQGNHLEHVSHLVLDGRVVLLDLGYLLVLPESEVLEYVPPYVETVRFQLIFVWWVYFDL